MPGHRAAGRRGAPRQGGAVTFPVHRRQSAVLRGEAGGNNGRPPPGTFALCSVAAAPAPPCSPPKPPRTPPDFKLFQRPGARTRFRGGGTRGVSRPGSPAGPGRGGPAAVSRRAAQAAGGRAGSSGNGPGV